MERSILVVLFNMTLRKVIKNKRLFPSDDAVFNVLYLATNNIAKNWAIPIRDWKSAMYQFIIIFDDSVSI